MAGEISTPRDAASHYNCPMSAFPLHERAIYTIVMAVLWAFSKVMWRWHLEYASEIETAWFDGVSHIGVTAGASTPASHIERALVRMRRLLES